MNRRVNDSWVESIVVEKNHAHEPILFWRKAHFWMLDHIYIYMCVCVCVYFNQIVCTSNAHLMVKKCSNCRVIFYSLPRIDAKYLLVFMINNSSNVSTNTHIVFLACLFINSNQIIRDATMDQGPWAGPNPSWYNVGSAHPSTTIVASPSRLTYYIWDGLGLHSIILGLAQHGLRKIRC